MKDKYIHKKINVQKRRSLILLVHSYYTLKIPLIKCTTYIRGKLWIFLPLNINRYIVSTRHTVPLKLSLKQCLMWKWHWVFIRTIYWFTNTWTYIQNGKKKKQKEQFVICIKIGTSSRCSSSTILGIFHSTDAWWLNATGYATGTVDFVCTAKFSLQF